MEDSTRDGYHLQAELVAEQMRQTHEGLTIELEILPIEETEREVRLKQLHTQIMSGNGPDVYLLPTGNTVTLKHGNGLSQDLSIQVQPLLYDVIQAMRSGIFADISAYYDADDALGTASLQTAVMDVGVIGGARYILPLHYDLPVLLTERKPDGDVSVTALTEAALTQGDTAALIGLQLPDDLSVFSQIFDYENGTMPLTADKIAAYMRLYQRWTASEAQPEQEWITAQLDAINNRRVPSKTSYLEDYSDLVTPSGFNEITSYIICRIYWCTAGLPCFRSTLADTLQSALAQLNNDDGTPTDVDIDKLAQQVWTDLWWHLAEG